jgi:hypothetical protein
MKDDMRAQDAKDRLRAVAAEGGVPGVLVALVAGIVVGARPGHLVKVLPLLRWVMERRVL